MDLIQKYNTYILAILILKLQYTYYTIDNNTHKDNEHTINIDRLLLYLLL